MKETRDTTHPKTTLRARIIISLFEGVGGTCRSGQDDPQPQGKAYGEA